MKVAFTQRIPNLTAYQPNHRNSRTMCQEALLYDTKKEMLLDRPARYLRSTFDLATFQTYTKALPHAHLPLLLFHHTLEQTRREPEQTNILKARPPRTQTRERHKQRSNHLPHPPTLNLINPATHLHSLDHQLALPQKLDVPLNRVLEIRKGLKSKSWATSSPVAPCLRFLLITLSMSLFSNVSMQQLLCFIKRTEVVPRSCCEIIMGHRALEAEAPARVRFVSQVQVGWGFEGFGWRWKG